MSSGVGGDGPDLGDFSAAVSSVQDDGSDVTLVFEDGGSLLLAGLGTGAIDSVNALLSEIGSSSVEVVRYPICVSGAVSSRPRTAGPRPL